MARRTLQLVVQQEEPDRGSLWINPYNGVVRIYAQNKGWIPLQGPLFIQLNDKVDAEVGRLDARIDADERKIQANAEAIEGLGESKQDALTPGYGISISGDNVISCTLEGGGEGGDYSALEARVTALENEVRSLDVPSIEEMDEGDVDEAWDETMNG